MGNAWSVSDCNQTPKKLSCSRIDESMPARWNQVSLSHRKILYYNMIRPIRPLAATTKAALGECGQIGIRARLGK